MLLADDLFLGHDLLAWLVLAMGAALAAGNIAALGASAGSAGCRGASRSASPAGDGLCRDRVVAAVWALATLIAG